MPIEIKPQTQYTERTDLNREPSSPRPNYKTLIAVGVGTGIILIGIMWVIMSAPASTSGFPTFLLFIGGFTILMGISNFISSLPIPDVDMSEVPWALMTERPSWLRMKTTNRTIQNYIAEFERQERLLEIEWQYCVKARHVFEDKDGDYFEYLKKRWYSKKTLAGMRKAKATMELLDTKVKQILSGDVDHEIEALNEAIEKFKLQKQNCLSELTEIKSDLQNVPDKDGRRALEKRQRKLSSTITAYDEAIIEANTEIKEFQRMKSKNLYKDLKVKPVLATATVNDLKEVRDKSHIVDGIIPNEEPSKEELEKEKRNEIKKIKNAIQYNENELEKLKNTKLPDELKQREIQIRENEIVELQDELHILERELRQL